MWSSRSSDNSLGTSVLHGYLSAELLKKPLTFSFTTHRQLGCHSSSSILIISRLSHIRQELLRQISSVCFFFGMFSLLVFLAANQCSLSADGIHGFFNYTPSLLWLIWWAGEHLKFNFQHNDIDIVVISIMEVEVTLHCSYSYVNPQRCNIMVMICRLRIICWLAYRMFR